MSRGNREHGRSFPERTTASGFSVWIPVTPGAARGVRIDGPHPGDPALASWGVPDRVPDTLLTGSDRTIEGWNPTNKPPVATTPWSDSTNSCRTRSRSFRRLTWQQALAVAARFHDYSFANTQLIWAQSLAGFSPSRYGYRAWQELGRHVRHGERGLQILAPVIQKIEPEKVEEEERRVVGFRVVHVFDIGQTEGVPLPEVPVALVEGDLPAHWDRVPRADSPARDPQRAGRDGAAGIAGHRLAQLRARSGDALQRLPRRRDQRRSGAGLQLGAGAGRDRRRPARSSCRRA